MMKKKFLIPLAAFGMLLSSCGEASLPIDYKPGEENDFGDITFVPYELPIDGVEFEDGEDSIYLKKGDTYEYRYSIFPKKASKSALVWTTSDANVATVSAGVVTATGGGNATITVSGGEKATFTPVKLNVNVRVPIVDFSIEDAFDLDFGESKTAKPFYNPGDTTEQGLSFHIEDESIATVDEAGSVTAKNKAGTTTLTVTSVADLQLSHSYTVKVSDKFIYVDDIKTILGKDKMEVGTSAKLTNEVISEGTPTTPLTDIKYHTDTPEIVSVDENTGEITALEPGKAKVYASLYQTRSKEGGAGGDFIGTTLEFDVFEVSATSLTINDISKSVVQLDNIDNPTLDISYTYETDSTGVSKPSRPNVKYICEPEDIVEVDENGGLSVKAKGDVKVTVKDEQYDVEDYFDVHVTIKATSIVAKATSDMLYIDGAAVKVSGDITPAGVTDGKVEYEITEGKEFVNSEVIDNELVLTAISEGTVKVVAKTEGLTSEEKIIKVDEADVAFVEGNPYLVGNAKYKAGVAKEGLESWVYAKYAYKFGEPYHEGNLSSYKVLAMKFNEGNKWKIKEGKDGWREIGEKDVKPGYYKIEEGAFAGEDPAMSVVNEEDTTRNIIVNKAGYYDIYYDVYDKGDAENEFFSVYAQEHLLGASVDSLKLDQEESQSFNVTGWIGTPHVTNSDDSVITVSEPDSDGKVTVTALNKNGTANITITDDNDIDSQKKEIVIPVTVEKIVKNPVYVNANGMMDTDGVYIYAHAWKSDTEYKDYKFAPVSEGAHVYTALINEAYINILFARCTDDSFSSAVNQTEDLKIENGNNMWTMNFYGGEGNKTLYGWWSVYNQDNNYNFDGEKMYMVGNKDFHDITSVVDGDSWENADKAHVMELSTDGTQYEVHDIRLTKDTKFRFRTNSWIGASLGQDAGAISQDGDNFVVNTTGRYNLFLKVDDHKLYFANADKISLDPTSLIVDKGATETITVNNAHGSLTLDYDSDYAEVTDNGDNTLTVTGVEYGSTVLTVTDDDGDSATCNINVGVPFTENKIYLVGNKDYSSGTSSDTGASWNTSDKAYLIGDKVVPETGETEVTATITFSEGDNWRIRVGNTNGGNPYPVNYIDPASGAIIGRQMHKDDTTQNMIVDVAGTYTIYVKTGSDGGHSMYIGCEDQTRVISLNPYEAVATGDAWFALWAWKDDGPGRFYYGASLLFLGDTTNRTLIVVPKDCNKFKVLRMEKGIDPTSDWFDINDYDSFKDHIWNASGDLTPTKFELWNLEYFFGDGSICVTNID